MPVPPPDLRELLPELAQALRTLATITDALAAAVPSASDDRLMDLELQVDRAALQVRWRGRTCFLGYSVLFRVMECLARQPNTYVSHEELMRDVWEGQRSPSTIRSAIAMIRKRLIAAKMEDLAAAIDGRTAGRYRLCIEAAMAPAPAARGAR